MTEQATWVTMNDGVRLDVSVHRPDGAPPPEGLPAVLLVHGHGENGSKARTAERARRLGRGAVWRIGMHRQSRLGYDGSPLSNPLSR